MRIIDDGPVWTDTMDKDGHVVLRCGRKIVFEGSYEALCAEAGVDFPNPPLSVMNRIHDKAERLEAR